MAKKKHCEAPDMTAFVTRVLSALARRTADGDLQALAALVNIQRAAGAHAIVAARNLNDAAGPAYSWQEIGDALSITRQSAHERFALRRTTSSHTGLAGGATQYSMPW